MKPTVHQTQTM